LPILLCCKRVRSYVYPQPVARHRAHQLKPRHPIRELVEVAISPKGVGLTRAEKVFPVTFNAWRFGGEDLKRALLRHVFVELGGDDSVLKDRVFRQIQRSVPEPKTRDEVQRELREKWLWPVLQVIVVFVIALVLLWLLLPIITSTLVQTVLVGGVIAAAGFAIRWLLDPRRFVVSTMSIFTRLEPPSSSAEEYEDLLKEQLRRFKSGAADIERGKSCERLVVFVDDLDRLSAEEMVNGLDAIRTFMEIPQEVPEGPGMVLLLCKQCHLCSSPDSYATTPSRLLHRCCTHTWMVAGASS
jgi:hypothetical protein